MLQKHSSAGTGSRGNGIAAGKGGAGGFGGWGAGPAYQTAGEGGGRDRRRRRHGVARGATFEPPRPPSR